MSSVRIGAYSLEVATLGGSFAQFEPEPESENAEALEAALEEEAGKPPAPVAALERFEETADEVTGRIEQADKLLRTGAAGELLDLDNVTGEVDLLLDLFGRLDRAGRFEEELKLMRSLNGLLALTLRWLDLIRSLRSLLRSAEGAKHVAGQAYAHHELGSLNLCAGRAEAAQSHLRDAFRLQSQIGDLTGQCATRHNLDSARRDALARSASARPPRRLPAAALAAAFALLGGGGGTALGLAIRGGGGGSDTGSTESKPLQHTLTVKLAGKGKGSVSGGGVTCRGSCRISVEDGHAVTLRAKEVAGSSFAGWEGVDCPLRRCPVTVHADRSVTAVFAVRSGGDTKRPTPPTDLRATASSGTEIELTWTASRDNVAVTGYVIYRGGVKYRKLVGTTTNYRDAVLKPSTDYRYTVRATDAAGNLSEASNEATERTLGSEGPDVKPPTQPTDVTGDPTSATEIVITWSASDDTVGVSSYVVYRDGKMVATVSGDETSYHDSGLDPDTTYSYTVVAVDSAQNESPASDPAEATTFTQTVP